MDPNPCHRVGIVGGVLVAAWLRKPTREAWTAMVADIHDHATQLPEGHTAVVVLAEGTEPPPIELRITMLEEFESAIRHMGCIVWVLEGHGFAHRMKLEALSWFLSRHSPSKRVLVRNSMRSLIQNPPPDLPVDWAGLGRELVAEGYLSALDLD